MRAQGCCCRCGAAAGQVQRSTVDEAWHLALLLRRHCRCMAAAAAAGHLARCISSPHLPVAVCREELQQPVFSAIDALEFPELHDESIPSVAFQRHLGRLLAAAGVRDFSLKASTCCVAVFRCSWLVRGRLCTPACWLCNAWCCRWCAWLVR